MALELGQRGLNRVEAIEKMDRIETIASTASLFFDDTTFFTSADEEKKLPNQAGREALIQLHPTNPRGSLLQGWEDWRCIAYQAEKMGIVEIPCDECNDV